MTTSSYLLDQVRKHLDIRTDVELAERLDVSRNQLYRWRRGDDHMSSDTAVKVAKLLDDGDNAFWYVTAVGADREKNPETQKILIGTLQEMNRRLQGRKPKQRYPWLDGLGGGKILPLILIASVATGTAFYPTKPALSAPVDAGALRGDCILCQ